MTTTNNYIFMQTAKHSKGAAVAMIIFSAFAAVTAKEMLKMKKDIRELKSRVENNAKTESKDA